MGGLLVLLIWVNLSRKSGARSATRSPPAARSVAETLSRIRAQLRAAMAVPTALETEFFAFCRVSPEISPLSRSQITT
jgi:hypothetical protein